MCVGKFHCECWSIPVKKIHYIDVVVLRHTSYRVERFDNPSNSVARLIGLFLQLLF
jgi:hypothetical protein